MAILKVIEILANSKKSWEEATQNAVKHAAKSLRNIKSANVSNMSAEVDKKGIESFEAYVNALQSYMNPNGQ